MIGAIFDLDGTLYTGHITLGIAEHHRQHRVKRLRLYAYMAVHLPLWLISNVGLVSPTASRELWARNLAWTVGGWTTEEGEVAFAWICEHYVLPRIRASMTTRIREHRSAGHRVIIVSGTFAPLLDEIGRHLGVADTVGTPLVVREGRFTGACELPVCQGQGKVSRLEQYLGSDERIQWPESYAYADSLTDLPLLERIGHPIAAYPDRELAAHAQANGWEVIN
jgi:HAD superfamily hydrolase (TIGR01490 family)